MFDFQTQIERLFQNITWKQLGLAATLVFALLSVAEITVRLGSAKGPMVVSAEPRVRYVERWNDRDNPDSFKRIDLVGIGPDDTFAIAWIAASGILIRRAPLDCSLAGRSRYSQPQMLTRKFRSIDGKPVRTEEYVQSGMGAYDLRRAVLHAIGSTDTDAIIVEMNPIVFLNDLNVFGASRQRADIIFQSEARAFDFATSMPVVHPSDVAFAAFGLISELVRQRGHSPLIVKQPSVPFPTFVPESDAAPKARPRSKYVLMRPKLKLNRVQRRYSRLFYQPNTAPGSPAADIIVNTFADLKASGKKVLVYMTPFNTKLRDKPEIAQRIREIQNRLQEMAAPFEGGNFAVRSDTGLADIGRLEFNDFIHFSCGMGELDMVADELARLMDGSVNIRPNSHIYGPRK